MRTLSVLLSVLFFEGAAFATTYYVNPNCATSGTGLTETCGSTGPFRTWAEVPWAAGNTYAQKGGTTYYGTITVGASGGPGAPVTITSYGEGKALLDGGVVLAPESWGSPDANGVYSQAGFGYGLLEDDVFLQWCPTAGCASGAGNYRYVWGSGSPEYYKPTSGTPANHVTKKLRTVGIQLNENSYVNISNFALRHYTYGITGTIATSGKANNFITITNNAFSDMQFGVWLDFNKAVSTGVVVSGNTFSYIMSSIEMQNKGDCKNSPGIFDSVVVSNNEITHCAEIRGVGTAYYWDTVNTAGWDMEGIGFQNLSNSSINDNIITGHCRGVVLFVCAGDEAFNNNFFRNKIDTDGECLMLYPRADTSPSKSFYGNNVYGNILARGNRGWNTTLYVGNVPNPVAQYNKVYNNTFVSSGNAIFGTTNTDYYDIRNNIFYDVSNYMVYLPAAVLPSHVIFDYNLYKSRNPWMTWWAGGSSKTWATWKALGDSFDPHSPEPANPLFTNAAAGDYSLSGLSPARRVGLDLGVGTDLLGRPYGTPPSLGALEFHERPSPPSNVRPK